MKKITILLNFILLILTIHLFDEHVRSSGEVYFWFFLIIPIFSIYTAWSAKGGDWLSLLLKRKALEEKKKIEKLQN